MVVKKFNYFRFFAVLVVFIGIIVGIVFGIVSLVKGVNYKKSNEYKLLTLGYNESEIELINNRLNDEKIKVILSKKYDKNIISFLSEKYFIFENLDKYLEYYEKNKKKSFTDIVSYINCEIDFEWIDDEKKTNIDDNYLMLVNRIYGLDKDYEPDDLVTMDLAYATNNIRLRSEVVDNIIYMFEDAKMEGFTYIVSDGYRSYKEQEKTYNQYVNSYGRSEADDYVAKPGHSEYQTGLTFNVIEYAYTGTEHYNWLQENAYKYGFIFRLPSDKEDLTQFYATDTKLRYVGIDAASIIYNEKICFEEYYAYFVGRV